MPALEYAIRDELKRCTIDIVVTLPDTITRDIHSALDKDPNFKVIGVNSESSGVAVCAGLYLGGKYSTLLIANQGFYNAMDAIRGLPINYHIPMLALFGYGGAQTESQLKLMEIPYHILENIEDVGVISTAFQEALKRNGPVAVLLKIPADR